MRRLAWLCLGSTALVVLLGGLLISGLVRFNYPDPDRFPVRGVDVSHHQGSINWTAVRSTGVAFAFIKATEGATHQDRLFAANWRDAMSAGLSRGAYHFFTFCTPGAPQASDFIRALAAR